MTTQEKYAKRKKRKKAAWIVLGISTVVCTSLGIIAFLGRVSGQYTIQLATEEKNDLTLFTTYQKNNDGLPDPTDATTYLSAKGLTNGTTYSADSLPDDAELDSSVGGAKNGTRDVTLTDGSVVTKDTYLCYTFYVKNVASQVSSFAVQMNFNFTDPTNIAPSLYSFVRVRLFENLVTGSTETHNMSTYAATSTDSFLKADGTTESRECIGAHKYYSDTHVKDPSTAKKAENQAFATEFVSDSVVFSKTYYDLAKGDSVRYTTVIWLEGDDPDCKGSSPENATMTFSMGFQSITTAKQTAMSSASAAQS